ncbi:phosphotransferase family protein [Natrononativus amylolyticus]|uniref:phosphotransferase family protein n=1 Tax=Natrononativus amylolyticus TaxID=2963434 RepID=UPI0020CB7868|nr:aminoglycoside phosphotransferase family protein [Natrononativus amylolyticus]
MDALLATALEAAAPDRQVATVSEAGPSWNDTNRTVAVEFADGTAAYLKVAASGDGSRIARERAVITYLDARRTVPVPSVLAGDPSGAVPYLLTEAMAGDRLLGLWADADPDERTALARRVGAALGRVHGHRFEDHGQVAGGGSDGLELETAPWTDVLVETVEEMRAIASCSRFDDHFDRVIAAVESNRGRLEAAPAALLHGDPARPNCVRRGSEIGLLDWELAHVGDPARDLVRVRDQQLDSLRERASDQLVGALHAGYRAEAGSLPAGFEDRRPIYEAVRLLGVSGFFDKVVAFVDEPTDELESWLEAELDRRLEAL